MKQPREDYIPKAIGNVKWRVRRVILWEERKACSFKSKQLNEWLFCPIILIFVPLLWAISNVSSSLSLNLFNMYASSTQFHYLSPLLISNNFSLSPFFVILMKQIWNWPQGARIILCLKSAWHYKPDKSHLGHSPQKIVSVSFCNIFVAGVPSQKGVIFFIHSVQQWKKIAIYTTFKFKKKICSFIISYSLV